jgi:hypothetical protein
VCSVSVLSVGDYHLIALCSFRKPDIMVYRV